MKIKGVENSKCIKCKECLKECGFNCYRIVKNDETNEKSIIFDDPDGACIKCGHCVAVCPADAIEIDDEEAILVLDELRNPEKLLDYDSLINVFRARRSIRRYQEKPVPIEEIEAIIDASKYAPSAHNNQSWEYLIYSEKEKLQYLEEISKDYIKKLLKMLLLAKRWKFLLPKELREELLQPALINGLKDFIKLLDSGENAVLHNAPIVIICCSNSTGTNTMAGADVGIALSHVMFAAQTRGLGSCWIGFTQEAILANKKVKKALGIPKGRLMCGVLTIGYPNIQYHRAPPRENLNIKWNPEVVC